MRTEAACPPADRYLVAQDSFSDAAVNIWQQECRQRRHGRAKSAEYEAFVQWKRQPNEIAVFTLYAYADLPVPTAFDCVFRVKDPQDHVLTRFELTQSVWEAWWPFATVAHGHKHLCVFSFAQGVPAMLGLLHQQNSKFSTTPAGQQMLGFCDSRNLPAITEQAEKEARLRAHYGADWWAHDEVE
ncbi:MAG TPA: hypothetical protein VF690_12150 [Hymenobacter sp.]|jgi:hypothetical protein